MWGFPNGGFGIGCAVASWGFGSYIPIDDDINGGSGPVTAKYPQRRILMKLPIKGMLGIRRKYDLKVKGQLGLATERSLLVLGSSMYNTTNRMTIRGKSKISKELILALTINEDD